MSLLPRPGAPLAAAALLLSLAAALTGCSTEAAPTPGAPPTPSSGSETTAPVDPLMTVTTVVARGDALEFHDAAGAVVDRFGYTESPARVIEALTVVFGRAPVEEERAAVSLTIPSRTLHSWDGMTLEERLYPPEILEKQEESGLTMPDFLVAFERREVNGIRLTTVSGISAGDSLDAIDVPREPADQSCVGPAIDQIDAQSAEDSQLRVGVALSDFVADDAAQTITPVDHVARVVAPVAVGPGCT